jgi:hypothetical protein
MVTVSRRRESPHAMHPIYPGQRDPRRLKRVMLHAAPLADPRDVAWFLASYARDAKARMAAADLPRPWTRSAPRSRRRWA